MFCNVKTLLVFPGKYRILSNKDNKTSDQITKVSEIKESISLSYSRIINKITKFDTIKMGYLE